MQHTYNRRLRIKDRIRLRLRQELDYPYFRTVIGKHSVKDINRARKLTKRQKELLILLLNLRDVVL